LTEDLPAPLTPAECDLRDFADWMPLMVQQLRDSDMAATPNAEVFRAAVLSWCASWHQVPAASLPDDTAAIARLVGMGRDVDGMAALRDAGALRGFVKCSDGRLYHPVIAERAIIAWDAKHKQRDRTQKARDTVIANRQSQTKTAPVTGPVTKPVTGSKVSEVKVRKEKKVSALARFDDFWVVVPKKVSKGAAEKAWPGACALTTPDILIAAMTAYATKCAGKEKQYILHPATWLNGKSWLDEGIAPAPPPSEATTAAAITIWEGRAAALIEKIGADKFMTWFGTSKLEDGPPKVITFPKLSQRNWAANNFRSEIERALGPCELKVAT